MNAVNDVTEPPLVRTRTLSTSPMKDNVIDVLAVDFALLLSLFEKLFGMGFGTLFLAKFNNTAVAAPSCWMECRHPNFQRSFPQSSCRESST